MSVTVKLNKLSPLLKYPGGKEKELNYILPNIPHNCLNYYEPFIGGGAVYFALDCNRYFINDKSSELINLYKMISDQNEEFISKIKGIDHNWSIISALVENHRNQLIDTYFEYKKNLLNIHQLSDSITEFVFINADEFNGLLKANFNISIENFVQEIIKSLKNKILRMAALEQEKGDLDIEDVFLNLEGAFKNAFYMHFRFLYNNIEELNIETPFATAIYFFIREFCYSSMYRYNKFGKFNVPYGGISYNKKSLLKKIEYFTEKDLISQLKRTTIGNDDFEAFFNSYKPNTADFIFLDPPYDTEFSTYAQNEFDQNDQARLANYLVNKCEAKFMLIIKNTDYILSLYPEGKKTLNGDRIYVSKFDKKYFVSFQDRNDKNAEHLLITNYPLSI
jgi:DNA adenine methylase